MYLSLVKRHLAFHKKWEQLIAVIESIPKESLERFDEKLGKLKKLYYSSSIRLLCQHIHIEDAYTPRLEELQQVLDSRVRFRFQQMRVELDSLIQNIGDDNKSFNSCVDKLKLLAGFQKRWHKTIQTQHVIIDMQRRLQRHHRKLFYQMTHTNQVKEYQEKLSALKKLGFELDTFYDWYCDTYLNVEGCNRSWTSQMPVGFLDSDPKSAPLEHCIKIPTDKELAHMEKVLDQFFRICKNNELIQSKELARLKDYERFIEYADKFSLASKDSKERLKAAVFDQLSTIHSIISDANARHLNRQIIESNYLHSFVAYFAPVDEVIRILNRGYIDSSDSLSATISNTKGIPLTLHPKIHDGDMGFIFPLTKVISKKRFFEIDSDIEKEIHIFEKPDTQSLIEGAYDNSVKIDIRDGVFIAPRDKLFKYHVGNKEYNITAEEYFNQFFEAMASNPAEWFDPSRLEGWLSRHCIFYYDMLREELLGLLEDQNFVSTINKYTNKAMDNLAFYHVKGSLTPTADTAEMRFIDTVDSSEKTINLTLFEWKTEKK